MRTQRHSKRGLDQLQKTEETIRNSIGLLSTKVTEECKTELLQWAHLKIEGIQKTQGPEEIRLILLSNKVKDQITLEAQAEELISNSQDHPKALEPDQQ